MGARCVAVVAVLAVIVAACADGAEDDTAGLPRFSAAPSAEPSATVAASEPSDAEQILAAYRTYTTAVSEVLAAGDADLPALQAAATGDALDDARARVQANRRDGVVTTGALEPSATTAQVEWSGGDRAVVSDCALNGLEHVEADRTDEVESEATGTRRPVEATLSRTSDGWSVSAVAMPQDEDAENAQKDPPFLRGPMPDGPPSCAPPELEQELLARYQAFWDAFDRAFGFGRDGPADPDDPALAATSVDPQLSDTRAYFGELQDKNRTSRGQPDSHDPWVLGVTRFDEEAFIGDCVTLGDSETVDLDTGKVVEQNDTGRIDYEETRLTKQSGSWLVAGRSTKAKGLTECASGD